MTVVSVSMPDELLERLDTFAEEHEMMHLRHEYDHLVTSNVHNHVGDHYCMELFILEGSLEDISTFVGKIRATQDTLSLDYSVMPVDSIDTLI